MASGSSSEVAEPAEPAAAPAAAETEEDQVKRRRLQCLDFALAGRCDATTAPTLLSENNWQTQVSSPCSSQVGGELPPSLCLCFSESVERLLRTSRERPSRAAPASDVLQLRGLVSDGGRGLLAEGGRGGTACWAWATEDRIWKGQPARQGWRSQGMLQRKHGHFQRDLPLLFWNGVVGWGSSHGVALGYPGTRHVNRAGLKLGDQLASASLVEGA